uniref:POU domain protein n=1 Tax=Panagrolaimus sp. PS1159 TaxID=55785 RepID=A0AC35GJN1_9BILA
MTFYDGSHDYHPCEYDFDALWSQFEEQKDNDAITSCSSVEICQPLIPQPSRQELSLAIPQPPQISQSSAFAAPSSSSKIPLSPSHQQQLNLAEKTKKQEPVLCSQFEGQRNNNEHAETSRSTTELPSSPHHLHQQHTQHHNLPLASWPTLPHPQPSAQFLKMEKYSSSPEMAHPVPQPSLLSQSSSTLAEYSLSSEVPRVRPPRNSSKQQPPRRRVKRKAPKQEPLDENVALPSGFDRVLENAAINGNNIIDVEKWEPPRRRDSRRCETKVMLQTADGHLFNKYFEEEDIEDFARRFKALRCEYGFSQADVGAALGRRYGSDFSQTTVSRFEGLVLSHSNMCKLRPPIEQWITGIESAIESGISLDQLHRACKNGDFWPSEQQSDADVNSNLVPPLRKRRKRTSLDASQRLALDSYFDVNQRPDNAQMADIAKTLDLEFEVVRIWFCNRRQKTRNSMPKIKNEIDSDTSSSPIY